MQELQVTVEQQPGVIDFNFEELKEQLSIKMSEFKDVTVCEESKAIARKELAGLRKLKESVEKRRKEAKAQAMLPYTEFEKKVKELTAIIDEPINLLDQKIKEIERERIKKRREDVRGLWEKHIAQNGAEEYLPFDDIYDSKWNNSGTTLKSVEKDIVSLAEKAASDINIIRSSQSDVIGDALDKYKATRDLAQALTYINAYEANKKRALELEERKRKEEEECRRQQEIDRAKAEERQKLAEIEQARADERRRAELAKPDPVEMLQSVEDEVDELPFEQPTTKTVFYKVVATSEELEQVEMAFNSIGIYFERREA